MAPNLRIEAALAYAARGWRVCVWPAGSKGRNWPDNNFHCPPLTVPALQQACQEPCNVGVYLGECSGGLVDVDIDHAMCLSLLDLLPPTPLWFGRPGRNPSHLLYRVTSPIPTYKYPRRLGNVIEIRAAGRHTLFPPSVHPSGQVLAWGGDRDAEPPIVAADELLAAVAEVADTVRNWLRERLFIGQVIQC